MKGRDGVLDIRDFVWVAEILLSLPSNIISTISIISSLILVSVHSSPFTVYGLPSLPCLFYFIRSAGGDLDN